ncbi:hypothetical protein [Ktedonobacter racemifer]|uniref:DUF2232 domain-containing protein n=1 Tax=Ktedonobacter racemifer DSM 44963 TaxID=485913 RepID=D6TFM2_KTERA|nr:hypothetical protein [Ktedonobacter racemifer]EFH88702.1 hypothetical protein Krac_10190 [Ktedonobacter racemifer DSM 44963]
MFRNLKAIEIAEGALLADVAVIAQLAVTYLPLVGDIFRSLIFLVFAVLVLRRGLYTACFGLGVALFLILVLLGPAAMPLILLECVGGLFLGFTMRLRLPHWLLLFIGITCGAMAFYGLVLLAFVLSGRPLGTITQTVDQLNASMGQLVTLFTKRLGWYAWWQHTWATRAQALGLWLKSYWWLTLYLAICAIMLPFVTIVYTSINLFVRLLGYDVRPFPGPRIERFVRRLLMGAFKFARGMLLRLRGWRRQEKRGEVA